MNTSKHLNMKTKKSELITFRLSKELKEKLIKKTIKETIEKNKIIKMVDVIREILEEGLKN